MTLVIFHTIFSEEDRGNRSLATKSGSMHYFSVPFRPQAWGQSFPQKGQPPQPLRRAARRYFIAANAA